MPCSDNRPSDTEEQLQRRLNVTTALLCNVMKTLREQHPWVVEEEFFETNPGLAEWENEHRIIDNNREALTAQIEAHKSKLLLVLSEEELEDLKQGRIALTMALPKIKQVLLPIQYTTFKLALGITE